MAEKNLVQLIKKFDLTQLKPVILIYGKEDFLKKQFISKVKEKISLQIVWGDELSLTQIKEYFASSSLFGEGNSLAIIDFDSLVSKLKKEEIKDFLSFISKIHIPDRLFLISSNDKLPAKEPYKSIKTLGDLVISPQLTPKAFALSIKKKIEREGKKIEEKELKSIVSKLKNDLWLAKNEVEKLILFTYDEEEIKSEHIEQVVIPKNEDNVFLFLDKFFGKDKTVLKTLRELVDTGHHPFEIQSLLLNQINRLLLFKFYLKEGKGVNYAFIQLNIKHPAMKGSIQKQASKVDEKELIGLIKELYSLEKLQKVDFQNLNTSLEEFILKWITS